VQGIVEDLPHSFETIQIVDKNVRVDKERGWTTSHLVVLIHILQKVGGTALILVAQLVDVSKAWDAILFPHAEPTFLRGGSLSEIVVDNGLRDTMLFANANGWNLTRSDKGSYRLV
jgi:hypothetical protein